MRVVRADAARRCRGARGASAGSRMPLTSELLPAPLTPVTAAKTPSGKRTSTSCRLCSRAPVTSMPRLAGARRSLGTSMRRVPER